MDIEAAAWFLFGGAVFVSMGLTLVFDAEGRARAVADWQKEAGGGGAPARGVVWVCRVCGTSFAAAGLALIAGTLFFSRELTARLKPIHLGPAAQLLMGSFFAGSGAAISALKMREWVGERRSAAFWSGWALIASFIVFGSFLLARLPLSRP